MREVVLYRKYRPRNFDEVLGQDHIVRILENAIKLNRLAHAYLFSGPHGTGKTTMARILARGVVCESEKGNVCGECQPCIDFSKGNAFDLIELDAASTRGIDQIRELKDSIELSPMKNRYKVYIIDEVHMLTKEAFNALLKTLEEPPAHVIFILATTELEKVPETIVSRCQRFSFRKIPENIIQSSLQKIAKKENINIDEESIGLLSVLSGGSFRDAQSMLGQLASMKEGKVSGADIRDLFGAPTRALVNEMIDTVINKDHESAITVVEEIVSSSIEPNIFLKFLLRDFRQMLLLKMNPEYEKALAQFVSVGTLDFLKSAKERVSTEEMEKILSILIEAYNTSHLTYLPHLPLELAVIKITKK